MKDKVEELSNIGIKAFAIGTGDEEVIDEGATIGGDCTVGESWILLPRSRAGIFCRID